MKKQRQYKDVKCKCNGKEYTGTYFVEDGSVEVSCEFGRKATQVGGSPEHHIAERLLFELVQAAGKRGELEEDLESRE